MFSCMWYINFHITRRQKIENREQSTANRSNVEMEDEIQKIRMAIYVRATLRVSWAKLSSSHKVTVNKLRGAFRRWNQSKHFCDPKSIDDILVTVLRRGRPRVFDSVEEKVLTEAALHFESKNTTLSKHDLADLVQHYVTMLPNRKL